MEKHIAKALPDMPDRERMIIRYYLIEAMGYDLDWGMFVSLGAQAGIGKVRELVESMADEAGLVDEEQFRAALHDDSPALAEHWNWLCQRCNLHQFHGCVALRNSAKAGVMAALRAIGQPATKHEIGEICGFSDTQVGGALSNLKGVTRADAERWGLKEWIDDEYDGIIGEIIQRLNEDGGVTTTERLLSEIPSKFGVSPASVDAYMKTSRFYLQDGTIRLADPSRLLLRLFDDVIHGRDVRGHPFWTFRAEERHFRGYSVTGVPPEFIKALGCEPDGRIMIRCASGPGEERQISVRWPLASTTGGSLGYLTSPLKAQNLNPGDQVRVTIVEPECVTLTKHEPAMDKVPSSGVSDMLRRMKDRRRAL